jgi:hypothetical protein
MQSTQPACPKCRKHVFELRMLKDEGVAAVRCVGCQSHFLLLDSEDYWFDVIQTGYPRLTRCTCKNSTFRLQLDYRLRDDGDVERVALVTHCTACRQTQRRMSIKIDYSPTRRLLDKPLTGCKNPEILYDLKELSLYATAADIARIVGYLARQGCSFAGVVREQGDSVLRMLSPDQAAEIVCRKVSYLSHYLHLYAMPRRVAVTDAAISTAKKEAAFWKRSEVIRIDSPTSMVWGSRTGKLYDISFSGEYIAGQKVRPKSPRFRKLTAGLLDWLAAQFVTWRGPNCFDNEQVHRRLFGKEFL